MCLCALRILTEALFHLLLYLFYSFAIIFCLTFATLQESLNKVKHHNVLLPYIPTLSVLMDFLLLLITVILRKHGKGQRGSLKLSPLQCNISFFSLTCFKYQTFTALHPNKTVTTQKVTPQYRD